MPASFFAKTSRRSVRLLGLGVCPCVFVKWVVCFWGVVLVSFLCLLVGLVCVFLFVFVCGYAGSGLVMCW